NCGTSWNSTSLRWQTSHTALSLHSFAAAMILSDSSSVNSRIALTPQPDNSPQAPHGVRHDAWGESSWVMTPSNPADLSISSRPDHRENCCGLFVAAPEFRLNPQRVHFHDQHGQIVRQHLREHFDLRGRFGFAPNAVPELALER